MTEIYNGGDIVTLDPERPSAEAVAVRDGVVVGVGNRDELDARAHAVYARLGWQVRPVQVRGVYPYHGTIGCLVNVLSRTPAATLAAR